MMAGRAKRSIAHTIWGTFVLVVRRNRKRVAVIDADDGRSVTYSELEAGVLECGNWLKDHGIAPGDHVMLCLPNGVQYVRWFLASLQTHATVVPIDPALSGELVSIVEDMRPAFLVTNDRQLVAEMRRRGIAVVDPVLDSPRVQVRSLSKTPVSLDGEPKPSRHAVILFTSGATGSPRGVVHSERSLLASVNALSRMHQAFFGSSALTAVKRTAQLLWRYRARVVRSAGQQAWYTPMSMATIGGLTVLLQALLGGHRLVLRSSFAPGSALSTIEKWKVNIFACNPTMASAMSRAQRTRHANTSSLLVFGLGAAPTTPELAQRLREQFKCAVALGYGTTELGGGVLVTRLEDNERIQTETVGKPFPGYEIKIVDDSGRELAPGLTGQLVCRSEGLGAGVFRGSDASLAPLSDGEWYATGDLATRDEHGNVRIVGRQDDVVIRGGRKIDVAPIEAALARCDDVTAVSVVGVPDPFLGERIVAFICVEPRGAEPDVRALARLCRAELVPNLGPDDIHVLKTMPTGSNSKPRRHVLRAMAMESLAHRPGSPAAHE